MIAVPGTLAAYMLLILLIGVVFTVLICLLTDQPDSPKEIGYMEDVVDRGIKKD